jgi:hypothetical protein
MKKLLQQPTSRIFDSYRRSIRRLRTKAVLEFLLVGLYSTTPSFPPMLMCVQAGDAKTGLVRFDEVVRTDFFAGMLGDKERLDRGMKFCEEILARDPKHADALVWHGGGLLTRAADAYRKGDQTLGDNLWNLGLKEMNNAVALQPDNMGIKIGRSATLIGVAQSGWDSTDSQSKALLESALVDYEKIYQWQKPYFSKLGSHSRGELLFGLASGWSILGNHEKARYYLSLIAQECAGTEYESEAKRWIKSKPETVIQHDCMGCHVSRN